MKKHLLIIALVMLFGLIAVNSGMAQSVQRDLIVTATVGDSCRITSIGDIAFGAYDPTDSTDNTAGSGDIQFRCVRGTSYDVYIGGTRTMSSSTSTDDLDFLLYTDPARTNEFPIDNTESTTVTAGGNGVMTIEVYGRITALQDVAAADDYEATLTATIEY